MTWCRSRSLTKDFSSSLVRSTSLLCSGCKTSIQQPPLAIHVPIASTKQEGNFWLEIRVTWGMDRSVVTYATDSVTIDLRNSTLGSDPQAVGYESRVDEITGGFIIAHDWNGLIFGQPASFCVIEDAVGGKGDDRLIGNSASNVLKVRKGADLIYAGMGSANVVGGGKGREQFLFNTKSGVYVIVKDFNRSKDRLEFDGSESAVSFQASKKQ